MSLPLIVTPEAEADMAEAKAWYEGRRTGLGEDFVLCVEAALEHVRRAPGAARQVQPGVRCVALQRFPYGVFYRVDPEQIAVLAVYHASRDPEGWKTRR